MNRSISNVAVAAVFFCCLGGLHAQVVTTLASGKCGAEGDSTNLTWTLTSDSILTISGSGTMADYDYYNAPPWMGWMGTHSNYGLIRTVFIGDSVTSIGQSAFMSLWADSIIIGKNVISIGAAAFYGSRLTSIIIPNGVTIIGRSAFAECYNLTSVIIPNSVASIEGYVFYSCKNLVSITIPNSVISIGRLSFAGCSRLVSLTIGNGVYNIAMEAFAGCFALVSVTIPDNVIAIGNNAFEQCINLTSLTIGESVSLIGPWAFLNCNNLASITVRAVNPPTLIGNEVFYNVPANIPIYVPCGSISDYQADTNWNYFANFISIDTTLNISALNIEKADNSFTINWQGDATLYQLYRNGSLLTTVNTNTYTDSNLTLNTTYCYQIKAIDSDCESLLSDTICQTFSDVGIKQLRITNYELRVYPNPTKGELTIENGELIIDNVEIYNVVGQKVMSLQPLQSPKATINVSHLANGVYFIKVNNKINKLIINKN